MCIIPCLVDIWALYVDHKAKYSFVQVFLLSDHCDVVRDKYRGRDKLTPPPKIVLLVTGKLLSHLGSNFASVLRYSAKQAGKVRAQRLNNIAVTGKQF